MILRPSPALTPKVVSQFHVNWEAVLPSFTQPPRQAEELDLRPLDMVNLFSTYLNRSLQMRKTDTLFILQSGPRRGEAASARIIATWITKVISLTYEKQGLTPPQVIRAHSTRGVAASWTASAKISVEDICWTASWSTCETFTRHYSLDVTAARASNFGNAVVSAPFQAK